VRRSLALLACLAAGCSTLAPYQRPVHTFEAAVHATSQTLGPYITDVNARIVEANLYEKILIDREWGTEDLNGMSPQALALRLRALSILSSYASALSTIAAADDLGEMRKTVQTLGTDVDALAQTIKGEPATSAAGGLVHDLGQPLTSLVGLIAGLALEHAQQATLERDIVKAAEPIDRLIDLLEADVSALMRVYDTSYAAIRNGTLRLSSETRKQLDGKDPRALHELIDQLVAESRKIELLRAVQMGGLLESMRAAHHALVVFVKSGKRSSDMAQLAMQVDGFADQMKRVTAALDGIKAGDAGAGTK
jgi:hypothetical protein